MLKKLLIICAIFAVVFAEDTCDEQYMKEWVDRLDTLNLRDNPSFQKQGFRFAKSECRDNTMIVNSYLLYDGDFSQREKDEFDAMVKRQICENYTFEMFADFGLYMEHNIFSKSGRLLHQITLNPRNCSNFLKSHNICDRQYTINEINRLNARMPMYLDEITAMTRASCANNTYIYNVVFFINYPMDSGIIRQIKNEMQIQTQNAYCSNSDAKMLRKLGVSVKYNYYLQNGTFLFGTSASPSSCVNF